jgi:hypothetical protein
MQKGCEKGKKRMGQPGFRKDALTLWYGQKMSKKELGSAGIRTGGLLDICSTTKVVNTYPGACHIEDSNESRLWETRSDTRYC